MAGIEAVIFNLDGTLFDHEASAAAGLHRWLRELGIEIQAEATAQWFRLEHEHMAAWRTGDASWSEQRRRRLRGFLPTALLSSAADDDALDALFLDYMAHYEDCWTGYPDATSALQAVRTAGYRTAVLTNGAAAQQNAKLARLGLTELAGPVIAAVELGVAKPDPRAFHAACAVLHTAPQHALYVGDDYDLDYLGARAAGMHAIHLDRAGIVEQSCRSLETLLQAVALLDRR